MLDPAENPAFRECGHSSALLNIDLTFEFLECSGSSPLEQGTLSSQPSLLERICL